nr:MAG TPA: hypothetical protein [Caudoviricetes sp.]
MLYNVIICYHVRLCSVVKILFSISSDSLRHTRNLSTPHKPGIPARKWFS